MTLKQLFAKPIDRDIKGVIKVGQDDHQNKKQELEEYVVTKELEKHFKTFFRNYRRGIDGNTDKMGVWISGFFGSGKSHFLKILSYLLANEVVDGKQAIEYFIDEQKFNSPEILADIQRAVSVSTDAVLFNIDAKSTATSKDNKEAIVEVLQNVFNEMQGYSGHDPYLADLERRLDEEGKYDTFKQTFQSLTGDEWEEVRHEDIYFNQEDIVETLVAIGDMNEQAANNWFESTSVKAYPYKIEKFAELVKQYIDKKGNNHHVVFLIDEIGQYIGDNSHLMLNLQTVTEELGTHCGGQAWVIVTSQQDIDSITKTKGNDFSKIQGRFDTRLSLSSGNVDEVIQKRLLDKTIDGNQELAALYLQKATILKNLLLFNDGIEKKLYMNEVNFAQVYPFIPYQFDLLGYVLTSIREHGASGKHLSEGERSMLSLFQESAVRVMNEEPGVLVPFHYFYNALEQFLDHSHKNVMTTALKNQQLNPEGEEECFAVNVLKTLFMIKYVKEINANLENITTLMVSQIDEDRSELKERVEQALRALERQTLIQHHNGNYIFLTNEEQEVNREINTQVVENAELLAAVSQMIFDDIYANKNYPVPGYNGKYVFAFNQVLDDTPHKTNQNHELTLHILTPYSDNYNNATTYALQLEKTILVVLENDLAFLEELRTAMQIEKFIRFNNGSNMRDFDIIKITKQKEREERMGRAKLFLRENLATSTIYIGGNIVQSESADFTKRMNDALDKMVRDVYNKLHYIKNAASEQEILALLKQTAKQGALDGLEEEENQHALDEVNRYLYEKSQLKQQITLKAIIDRFKTNPYGFREVDIEWLVGKLFMQGELGFRMNHEAVTLLSQPAETIHRYLTRKDYVERLILEKRVKAAEKQKKITREVAKELFNVSASYLGDDDDEIMKKFRDQAELLRNKLKNLQVNYSRQPKYPGKQVVEEGQKLLQQILQTSYAEQFFQVIERLQDELLDFAEDYEPIAAFFDGPQQKIFDKALEAIAIYDKSSNYFVHSGIEQLIQQMKQVIHHSEPYNLIQRLATERDEFHNLYNELLEEQLQPILVVIDQEESRVVEELEGKRCQEELEYRFRNKFKELREKAHRENNVADLNSIKLEADSLKLNYLNQIEQREHQLLEAEERARVAEQKATMSSQTTMDSPAQPAAPVKIRKRISVKQLNPYTTWQVESASDVERYIHQLEQQLLAQLEENTIINVEF